MGHVISEEGLKPDPAKIQGVQEMPTPESKQDVKRLLGMVNYLQKFAPNLSEATAPMRELLKEENQFLWDEEVQGRSFRRVKQLIVESVELFIGERKRSKRRHSFKNFKCLYSKSRDSVQSTNYNDFNITTSPPLKLQGEAKTTKHEGNKV